MSVQECMCFISKPQSEWRVCVCVYTKTNCSLFLCLGDSVCGMLSIYKHFHSSVCDLVAEYA